MFEQASLSTLDISDQRVLIDAMITNELAERDAPHCYGLCSGPGVHPGPQVVRGMDIELDEVTPP